ncbi:UDP-glucuronosyltransferase 2B17-like isoform X2 [Pteronotus mesoamericanus]|uniref:UDP-glucuronosyltransferase 2B17-like isoform X2 n=1 Tax=Pteronotus mesoamericanus TaxID=1884717 RepID=UPI0023EACE6A|nr:UDP-glucuronosyltransferase 2B17-like isoform X2 [Pteronotus parnellii mesoamericanus]
MSVKWIPVLLLLEQLSFQFSPGRCGRVLVWPTEYSHWMNMKIILDELVQRGHEMLWGPAVSCWLSYFKYLLCTVSASLLAIKQKGYFTEESEVHSNVK